MEEPWIFPCPCVLSQLENTGQHIQSNGAPGTLSFRGSAGYEKYGSSFQ